MEMMGNKRTIQLKEPEKKESKPITGFNSPSMLPLGMPLGISSRLDDDDLTLGDDRFSDLRDEELALLEEEGDGTEIEHPPSFAPVKSKKEPSKLAKAVAHLTDIYKRLVDGVNTHIDVKVPIGVRVYLNSWNPQDTSDIDVEATDGADVDFDMEAAKSKAVQALKSNLERDWETLKQQINDVAFKFHVDFDDVVMVLEDPNWEWADQEERENSSVWKALLDEKCWHGLSLKDCKPCLEEKAREEEDDVQ